MKTGLYRIAPLIHRHAAWQWSRQVWKQAPAALPTGVGGNADRPVTPPVRAGRPTTLEGGF